MKIVKNKITENHLLLQKVQKTKLKDRLNNSKVIHEHQENLLNPFLFACSYYTTDSQHIDILPYLEENAFEAFNLKVQDIKIPLHNHPALQVIIDNDPRNEQKKLKIKPLEEIQFLANQIIDALSIIKNTSSTIHDDITENIKSIVLLDAAYSHNFTIDKIYNAIFFSPPKDLTSIWLVDSLIHESSHNDLNLALVNIEDFFAIDPYALVFSSPFRKKEYKRGLFHVVHALYVVTKLCAFYDLLFQQIDTKNEHYNEVLGRLVLNTTLINSSIEEIDYEPFYTKNGVELLDYFKESAEKYHGKYSSLLTKYKLPKNAGSHLFSLKTFKEINHLQ